MTDDDFRCPHCGVWRVTTGLLADHVKKEHPDA
jgi:hypothetical protein